MDLVPEYKPYGYKSGRLKLLWSGQAVKLFELLRIEKSLRKFADRVQLIVVTNPLSAMDRMIPEIRARIESLLGVLSPQLISYENPIKLFQLYSEGGIALSPRFLDSPYNMGHTEWKVTLAMACGRMALCSPVPSYQTVHDRANGKGIRIVEGDSEWDSMFEGILSGKVQIEYEERAARDVVNEFYSTRRILDEHCEFLHSVVVQ